MHLITGDILVVLYETFGWETFLPSHIWTGLLLYILAFSCNISLVLLTRSTYI